MRYKLNNIKLKDIFKSSIFFYLLISLAFVSLIVLCYKDIFKLFYVQDDAWSMIGADHWWDYFTHNTLQYRPNSYLFTYILKTILGQSILTIRIGSILIHTINCILICVLAVKLTKSRTVGFISGVFFAVHNSLYYVLNLYLVAAMPGLGLTFYLISFILISNMCCGDHIKLNVKSYIISFICCILALLSYEGTITLIPMLLIVVFLNNTIYKGFRRVIKSLLFLSPYIASGLIYLALRLPAISSTIDSANSYKPSLSAFWGNALYYIKELPGFIDSRFAKIIIPVILLLAILFFVFYKKQRSILISTCMIILGILPFIFVTGNGKTPYYIMFSLVGVCIIMAYTLVYFINKLKYKKIMYVLVFIPVILYASLMIGLTWRAFPQHGLTKMSITCDNVVSEFKKLQSDIPQGSPVYFINMNEWLAWRIHFGNSINIDYEKNPYKFYFDYRDKIDKLSNLDKSKMVFIYVSHSQDDTDYKHLKLFNVTSKMTNVNSNNKIPIGYMESLLNASLFPQSTHTVLEKELLNVEFVQLNTKKEIPLEYSGEDFLFISSDGVLEHSQLLINEDKQWKIAKVNEGTKLMLTGTGFEENLEYNNSSWQLCDMNKIVTPSNDNYTLSEGIKNNQILNWNIGTSNGSTYEVKKMQEGNDKFVRITATSNADWIILFNNRPVSETENLPMTFFALARINNNITSQMELVDYINNRDFERSIVPIEKNNGWNKIYLTKSVKFPSKADYYSIGIYNVKKGDYFDVKEFDVYKGFVFKERTSIQK